jgi:hypothetical protein
VSSPASASRSRFASSQQFPEIFKIGAGIPADPINGTRPRVLVKRSCKSLRISSGIPTSNGLMGSFFMKRRSLAYRIRSLSMRKPCSRFVRQVPSTSPKASGAHSWRTGPSFPHPIASSFSRTVLHRFSNTNESQLFRSWIAFRYAGNLYGTAIGGGSFCQGDCGIVCEIAPYHRIGNLTVAKSQLRSKPPQ